MIRTAKVSFSTSRSTINALFALNHLSAEVWNTCLEEAKVYHQETGRWIGQTELQKRLTKRFPMHSQSVQAVCHKYLRARDGACKAQRKGHTHIRYPYKKKRHFNTRWAKDGFTIHPNGRIELKRGILGGKRQAPLVVRVAQLPTGTVKEVELVYDRGLHLCLTYENGQVEANLVGSHSCAIDPGEIHTLASVATTGNSLIVTGRKLRSIHRLRNKKLAELQRKMSRCKKHSRQWKRYNRAKQYLLSKSERQLRDALHKTTKQFVEWAVTQGVQSVTIGDVEGIQRHTSYKSKRRKRKQSRYHNQRLSQWLFGKTNNYLAYKLKAKGIAFCKREERYTSQTCPVCGAKKKISGRVYRCACGYTQHRDIHGAANLLSKVLNDNKIQPLPFEIKKPTYLRTA